MKISKKTITQELYSIELDEREVQLAVARYVMTCHPQFRLGSNHVTLCKDGAVVETAIDRPEVAHE